MSTADALLHDKLEERVCLKEYHAVQCEQLIEQVEHILSTDETRSD